MTNETSAAAQKVNSLRRTRIDLFLISALVLFLELACIRWFPAHVLFLTFFTNTVLLACFLGMSVGCLAASWRRNFILWTPVLLGIAMSAAHVVEGMRDHYERLVDVGNQASPQLVYFGTEYRISDAASFVIPIELVCGVFFLLIALAMVGPGQEMGRALRDIPNRVQAYTLNILGSIVGIALFAACAFWELSPFWWFLVIVAALLYVLTRSHSDRRPPLRWPVLGTLCVVLVLASLRSGPYQDPTGRVGEHLWSPYYRIDYDYQLRNISVNLIGHQNMVGREHDPMGPAHAYGVPYLLWRDSGGPGLEDVLIIGAGSGNDVSRALQWGARHVDAVEIDPVIQQLGWLHHPDRPYQDPRVTVYLDDGRNFLRATDRKYDLIVFALVDSLVLHSSYSNIRLESYLFTNQAFADVQRHLKPGGIFVMYNFFRKGWILDRLYQSLGEVFHGEPLVFVLPYRERIEPEARGGFTMFVAGNTAALRESFNRHPEYWLQADQPPTPSTPNGFELHPAPEQQAKWIKLGRATIEGSEKLRPATDEWPFLYLRSPMIPALSLRAMAIMGGLALLLIQFFLPKSSGAPGFFRLDGRMFFLGAGFMLIETKAVVEMALLLGSTWMVNTVVFFAVLVMILLANLFVLRIRPEQLWPFYTGLLVMLGLNLIVPLGWFLGMAGGLQVAAACFLVFTPILFAGVIFAVSFGRSTEPDRDFGANIAGAMLGGLAEYSSMLLGFKYLILVAIAFYAASAAFRRQVAPERLEPSGEITATAD